LAQARQRRPDLAAARLEIERIDAARTLTRRLAVPNPTVEAFYRREDFGPDRIAGGGLRIPLPLFDRRQGSS
jgi:outer membrane protein TolC